MTLVALSFTHQQILLIESRYAVQERAQRRAELLDQHNILLYNVLTLQSPQALEQRLARNEIELVKPLRTARMGSPSSISADAREQARASLLDEGRRLIARLLTPEATAEAEPEPY